MTNLPTEEQLQAWEKLCDEATPGEWEFIRYDESDAGQLINDNKRRICSFGNYPYAPGITVPSVEDMQFIAYARTAMPQLIAAYRELKDKVRPNYVFLAPKREDVE